MGYENSKHTFIRLTWPDNADGEVFEDRGYIYPEGFITPLIYPGSCFFFDRTMLNLSSDCENQWKMRAMVGHIEPSVVISKHV